MHKQRQESQSVKRKLVRCTFFSFPSSSDLSGLADVGILAPRKMNIETSPFFIPVSWKGRRERNPPKETSWFHSFHLSRVDRVGKTCSHFPHRQSTKQGRVELVMRRMRKSALTFLLYYAGSQGIPTEVKVVGSESVWAGSHLPSRKVDEGYHHFLNRTPSITLTPLILMERNPLR